MSVPAEHYEPEVAYGCTHKKESICTSCWHPATGIVLNWILEVPRQHHQEMIITKEISKNMNSGRNL